MSYCGVCNREVGRLASHNRYTHSSEQFECEVCSHISNTAGGLSCHRRLHERQIKIMCLQCNKEILLSKAQKNKRKFCSHACAAIYNNKLGKTNGRKFGPARTKPRKIDSSMLPFELKGSTAQKRIVLLEQNNCCAICKLDSWMDKKIPMSFHHKDGNKTNVKRENVEYLCFNCHAQTDNFGFKNRSHSKKSIAKGIETKKSRLAYGEIESQRALNA